MLSLFKNLFSKNKIDYPALLQRGALIIDVRTPAEFATGKVKGSINIPLGGLQKELTKLKKKNKPIIACCRSGARSGNATAVLKAAGVEAYNGGSWNKVQGKILENSTRV